MKKIFVLVVFFALAVLPAMASFCNQCGVKNPDDAKFCSKCGASQKAVSPAPDTAAKHETKKTPVVAPPKFPSASKTPSDETFRTKTDLYVYERRGDEKNVLKKNLFFKPRRYRIKANVQIRIKEIVGDTYYVQSLPDSEGKVFQGWVTEEELALRTEWKK